MNQLHFHHWIRMKAPIELSTGMYQRVYLYFFSYFGFLYISCVFHYVLWYEQLQVDFIVIYL